MCGRMLLQQTDVGAPDSGAIYGAVNGYCRISLQLSRRHRLPAAALSFHDILAERLLCEEYVTMEAAQYITTN